MHRFLLLLGSGLLGGALLSAGCDSFPAACESRDDCADGQLCQDGECLNVEPALLARCQGAEEVCNARDDDCDGTTDEGCAAGDGCLAGFGVCARMGVLSSSPQGLLCSADPGPPQDELCNGLDDDCDGALDEVCPPGTLCFVGVGGCRSDGRMTVRDGVRICVDDNADAVEPGEPEAETCGDRVDNDCDGEIDEGFGDQLGQPCTAGEGICQAEGVVVCVDREVVCSARPGPPGDETCDRRDNDCDGAIDEDFATGMPCTEGVGACQSSGTTICNGTQDGAVCNAVPRQSSPEECNAVDDDCDGETDEGVGGASLTRACGNDEGECRAGTQTCADGVWGMCEGQVAPIAELCNGRDDDCDGTSDQYTETCGSEVGACSAGTRRCIDGVWGECLDQIAPRDETCDGTDDDCDGVVDEAPDSGEPSSFFEVCGFTDEGACSFGQRRCVDGVLGACIGEVQPVAETCDAVDNDCDGVVDNGFERLGDRCVVSNGDCVLEGERVCAADGRTTVCDVALNPPDEACNGDDDDCDGDVDEGFAIGEACSDDFGRDGVCECGPDDARTCIVDIGGNPTPRPPTERAADGVDNDCDGEVDER